MFGHGEYVSAVVRGGEKKKALGVQEITGVFFRAKYEPIDGLLWRKLEIAFNGYEGRYSIYTK